MADQTPPTPARPSDSGLTGLIEKGATVHDAVGTSVGNVTDVDLDRQRLVIDGRPVGHDPFEVPLSAVASVKDNEVHLGIAIDAQTATPGEVPSFVTPPEPVTSAASTESAHSPLTAPTAAGDIREPVGHATFGAPIGTTVGATAPFTPTAATTSEPGQYRQGQRLSAGPAPAWADSYDFDDDEGGMFRPTMMGMAGLAAAGLAAAGFVWWRRRRRKSAWERALDLAADYAAQAGGYASQASGYASQATAQATDYASQVHPGWWAGLGSAALSLLLAYAMRPGDDSTTDRAWALLDSMKSSSSGLPNPRQYAGRWGQGSSGQWDRLREAASAVGATDLLAALSDRLPSAESLPSLNRRPSFDWRPSFDSLPGADDLPWFGTERDSRMMTYGLPAVGIALAGAVIYGVTRRAGSATSSTRVADVMTHRPQVIRPDASVAEAASMMRNLDVGAVPICDGSRLVGMLTDRDIAIRVAAEGRDPHLTQVRDVMSPGATWASEDDPVEEAARIMREHQIRRLPIVDERHNLVGIVSLGDLATETGDDRLSGDTLEEVSRR